MAVQKTDQLLEVLANGDVDFIVIGGVAALAHGAVTMTRDLDIAAPMTATNLDRLMTALQSIRPHHALRHDLGVIRETPKELTRFRLLLIDTDLGRLDVLGSVEPIGSYEDLRTVELELTPGKYYQVIDIDQLIENQIAPGTT